MGTRSRKKGWSRWITFEMIVFVLTFIAFLYFVFVSKDSGGKYKGLGPKEILYLKNIPLKSGRIQKKGKKVWKKEEKCREILKKLFNKPFPSKRPNFLKSPATGRNLELDCYNESMKLALEYDGVQHSKYSPHFHKDGSSEFIYQVARDDWKTMMCKKKGIELIRVPHWVPENELETYIKNRLRELGRL